MYRLHLIFIEFKTRILGRINITTKTFVLGVLLILGPFVSKAQQTERLNLKMSFPKEVITLYPNGNIYLSGQTLQYAVNCRINNTENNISDLVYVELISHPNNIITKQKLRLKDGKAYGDYFLPSTLKTGHYKLIAYTKWTLNNEDAPFCELNIFIINPFLNAEENNLHNKFTDNESYFEIGIDSLSISTKTRESNGLKISTDAKKYKHRSKVKIQLESADASNFGTHTILVKKIDSVTITPHNIIPNNNKKSNPSINLPEMRGELIQGIVTNAETKIPVPGKTVSLSLPAAHAIYKSVTTNDKGRFYINLFENFEREKGIIQVVDDNKDLFDITLEPVIFNRYDDLDFYPIKLNNDLKPFIIQNSIYNQVESAYYNVKQDSLIPPIPACSFYGEADLVYVLDDFKRFNSVIETFVEVIQGASIRKTKEGYKFNVQDINDRFNGIYNQDKPLLLLDGIQIQDENIVVDYNVKNIESISLAKGVFSLGSKIYNGIIDVKSKRMEDITLSGSYVQHIDIKIPLKQKEYFKQTYQNIENRIPDYRTQLLWIPNLQLDSDLFEIEFYTSDVSGEYLIEIKGFTKSGKSLISRKKFIVTAD